MTTIIERDGDGGGTAVLALAVIIAAIVVALFAFGAFDGRTIQAPAPNKTDINITAPAPSTPAPAPSTPSTPPSNQ